MKAGNLPRAARPVWEGFVPAAPVRLFNALLARGSSARKIWIALRYCRRISSAHWIKADDKLLVFRGLRVDVV